MIRTDIYIYRADEKVPNMFRTGEIEPDPPIACLADDGDKRWFNTFQVRSSGDVTLVTYLNVVHDLENTTVRCQTCVGATLDTCTTAQVLIGDGSNTIHRIQGVQVGEKGEKVDLIISIFRR